jgi:hypothetical protein
MKTMKMILLGSILIIAAFFSANVFSQECKYEVNEVDKFTSQKKIITEPITVVKKFKMDKTIKIKPISFQLKLENETYLLNLMFQMKKGNVTVTDKENLILMLSNGEQVNLVRNGFMPSAIIAKAYLAILAYDYIITPDQLELLTKYEITDVRVEAMINPFDFQIMEGCSTIKIFQCLK